jgi:hypothetical protein
VRRSPLASKAEKNFTAKTQTSILHRKDAKNAKKNKKNMDGEKNITPGLFDDRWSVRLDVPFCADQIFAQSSSSLRFLCVFASLR